MKSSKTIIAIIMSLVMLLSAAIPAFGADAANDTPIIFVLGLNEDELIDLDTGENAWPVKDGVIGDAIKRALTPDDITKIFSGDYKPLMDRVRDEVENVAGKIMVDKDGKSVYNIGPKYTTDLNEDFTRYRDPVRGYTTQNPIYYHHDWRLGPVTLAAGLNDLVEAVKASTGSPKVSLVSFSYGTCIASAYLEKYGMDSVKSFVLMAGAYNGMDAVGALFKGKAAVDAEAIENFIGAKMDESIGKQLVVALVDVLSQFGIDKGVDLIAQQLVNKYANSIFSIIGRLFFSWGSFWSFVPYEDYDEAKANVLSFNELSDEFLAETDYYHENVQGRNVARLRSAEEQGIPFGIIAQYGATSIPVTPDSNLMGDTNIETSREALGATCAKAGRTLGDGYVQANDDGHVHISADNQIDASTCAFPEYTWFIKNALHTSNSATRTLCDHIIIADSQKTVWDSETYPQFLIMDGSGIAPLTKENDVDLTPYSELDFFGKIKRFFSVFKLFFEWIASLIK